MSGMSLSEMRFRMGMVLGVSSSVLAIASRMMTPKRLRKEENEYVPPAPAKDTRGLIRAPCV